MKYFIAIACFVAAALAQPNPECSRENRPKVRPSECCKGAVLGKKEDFDKCRKLYPRSNSTEMGDRFKQGSLLFECFMNQTGILKNGKIDGAAALTQIMKSSDSSLRTVIKSAVDTCVKEDGNGGPGGPGGPNGQNVGPIAGKLISAIQGIKQGLKQEGGPPGRFKTMGFIGCVDRKVYESCPAAQKVTSDECTQLANFFEKCKPEKKD